MPDFYEISFLQAHGSRSGDAITLRCEVNGRRHIHLIDGGYASTALSVASQLRNSYGTNHVDNVVVTHPHQDHAEGLATILEGFTVGTLWMLRPWLYANELLPYFSRYNSAVNLAARLRDDYSYLNTLEEIAIRRGLDIQAPFQGREIGPFTVLAPTPGRYGQLIVESEKTPQPAAAAGALLAALFAEVAKPDIRFIREGWGSERFSAEPTDNENEMSVVQFARLNGHNIVLTGDAGRNALNEAAAFAPQAGLVLPGVTRFQVPHHGGRRNLSTEILDRWVGPRLAAPVPKGQEKFTAMISAAEEDPDHPRKAVLRALKHRGALIATTEKTGFCVWCNIPGRDWPPVDDIPYPDEQEE